MDPQFEWLQKEADESLVPGLIDFLKIPNQSRNFDPEWATNGLLQKVCLQGISWFEKQNIKNANIRYYNVPNEPPVVLIDIAGESGSEQPVLIYGHFDKQPPLTSLWRQGLGPYSPVIEGDKLYGRAAADDGYAFFEIVTVVKGLQKFNKQKDRIVLLFEADEESGSFYLPKYLEAQKNIIGKPKLIINMDSNSMSYEHLWSVTSFRGIINFGLKVEVASSGVHSGMASGIIPDTFRISRKLMEKLEYSEDGEFPISELYKEIPGWVYTAVKDFVKALDGKFDWKWPFLPGVEPVTKDLFQQLLNASWKPTITLIGVDGVPNPSNAGNVLRPYTHLEYSIRLPPHVDAQEALKALNKYIDEMEKPYNAKVTMILSAAGNGFVTKPMPANFEKAFKNAAQKVFKADPLKDFSGGSVPILKDFERIFPESPILNTGVCAFDNNFHGPNEFVSIGFIKKHTCALFEFLTNLNN